MEFSAGAFRDLSRVWKEDAHSNGKVHHGELGCYTVGRVVKRKKILTVHNVYGLVYRGDISFTSHEKEEDRVALFRESRRNNSMHGYSFCRHQRCFLFIIFLSIFYNSLSNGIRPSI